MKNDHANSALVAIVSIFAGILIILAVLAFY